MQVTRTRQKQGDKNYVDNKVFTEALHKYAVECRNAVEKGEREPVMSNYLGSCIIKMAERLSSTHRFRNYPYREDMVGNAILAAVKYAKNFDGTRFNNGFAYITQILFSHMVVTIKNEKKKYKTNMELIQQAELSSFGNPELSHLAEEHARSIADQKLNDLEEQKSVTGSGFKLRTGYTKEARAAARGTPLENILLDEKK